MVSETRRSRAVLCKLKRCLSKDAAVDASRWQRIHTLWTRQSPLSTNRYRQMLSTGAKLQVIARFALTYRA